MIKWEGDWNKSIKWKENLVKDDGGETTKIRDHLRGCMETRFSRNFIIWVKKIYIYLLRLSKLNKIIGEKEPQISFVTTWIFEYQDWITYNWVLGQRITRGIPKQFRTISCSPYTEGKSPLLKIISAQLIEHGKGKLMLTYTVPSLVLSCIFGTGRYSIYQRKNINTNSATNPLVNNAVLPARSTTVIVA